MKKLLLTLAGIALAINVASAQNYEKNIFGVNAGLNLSNLYGNYFYNTNKINAGFHVGVSYERLLKSNLPLYLETGLQYSMKGCSFNDMGDKGRVTASYLEIPVMVNYKFHINDDFSLYPSFGIYYGFALGGNEVWKYEGEREKYPLFGEAGYLKRSDVGLRVSATACYKRFTLSLGYEFGFINMVKTEIGDFDIEDYSLTRASYDDDDYDIDFSKPKARNGNLFISIGYNF